MNETSKLVDAKITITKIAIEIITSTRVNPPDFL
jgi:hypothetical protein